VSLRTFIQVRFIPFTLLRHPKYFCGISGVLVAPNLGGRAKFNQNISTSFGGDTYRQTDRQAWTSSKEPIKIYNTNYKELHKQYKSHPAI
jgi:hypothetical protein